MARIEPMLAKLVEKIPEPGACRGGCRYEPKLDGFRALGTVAERGAGLTSRTGKSLSAVFPEVRDALFDRLPECTVDGEIVHWTGQRFDFNALLRRNATRGGWRALELAAQEPAYLIVFDLLEIQGESLLRRPLTERRGRLEEVFADVPRPSLIQLGMQTADVEVAREWVEALGPLGVEGLVIKAADGAYTPAKRGWSKWRIRDTIDVIVGGVTGKATSPRELVLGRYDTAGRLVIVGRSTPLRTAEAADLAGRLHPAGPHHPWPETLPPRWGSRTRTRYVRVRPELVVEVSADVAQDQGRMRHPARYVRPRNDVGPEDVPVVPER
ncbi:ATP-dependent DNA ligase [Allonocardiopsis opalescens]|uniref:DNA ligase (ATP) n=2 Tax=Allonocardiopsis opalescens TaxID=1144618 RepID=A0A2T0PT76_9ACTN|nr:ATP-dependent DNA ligase [Allonocardiopsis opalescens]